MLSVNDKKPPSKLKAIGADALFYGGFTFLGLTFASLITIPAGASLAFLVAMPVAWLYHAVPGAAWALVCLAFLEMLTAFVAGGWFYVLLLSKLGGNRRQATAWIFAVTSILVWTPLIIIAAVSTFAVPGLSLASSGAGLLVPFSMLAGLIAQIYAALWIDGKVATPAVLNALSAKLKEPSNHSGIAISATKLEQMTISLAALKETRDLEQLNAGALDCLKSCNLSAAERQSSEADPVPTLLSILVKQKRHDEAEEISKHFLHVVEHHSALDDNS